MSSRASNQKVQKLFIEAATKLQQGDAAGARRGLEKVVKLAPDSAAVWYNLGLASQYLGLHTKAIREYQKSLSLSPQQVEALVNLGLSQKQLGDLEAAHSSAKKALNLVPGHPRALNVLGALCAEQNQHEDAKTYFKQSLAADPGNIDARQNLANAFLETNNSAEALETLQPLLGKPTTTREQLELHGQILLDRREFEKVQALIKDLKQRYPDEQGVLILEMSFCEVIKDHFSVVDIAQAILKQAPDFARVWNSLGSAYFQLDSIEYAKDSYLKAIQFDPEHPEYENNLGLAYASLGEKEQAEAHYRASVALNDQYIEAYRNLVAMRKFQTLDDPDVKKLEQLWAQPEQSDQMRCKLAFALGKVYDDCGEYDRAFETYDIGNRLKAKEITMDFDQYFSHIDRITQVLDQPPAQVAAVVPERAKPIFILGMSRSGTTLVEQIISRHPDVTGCGELPCIDRSIGRLEKNYGQMRIYPDDFPGLAADQLGQESAEYLNWVYRLHDIGTPRFTDKMPFNFVHIWLIRALFPDAAIIHCHRHPLDVIVSNYFQLYGSEINYVYDLEVLAKYYVRHYELMKHWHRVFPGDIYKVQYEAMVADSENQTRMLVEGARLEWDDVCLDQNRSDTAVRTASIWQVREGIYTSSRERWRRYEKHLAPAITILQKHGILDSACAYLD